MDIETFRHKGLKKFYLNDDASGLPAARVKKIRAILAALEFAENLGQVATFPGWRLHPLKGERKGTYSISFSGNWRITFRLEDVSIFDVNLEDYH